MAELLNDINIASKTSSEKDLERSVVLIAFEEIKKYGINLGETGIQSYESSTFNLNGNQCKLQYSFQRSPERGVYATISTRIVTLTGEDIVVDTVKFGEVFDKEILVGSNIETSKPFRRQGFGSALLGARENIIQTTINNYSGFEGKIIRAGIFDAADIPGWSSSKALQNGYKQVGGNIWTKTYIREPVIVNKPVLAPVK